MNENIIIDIQNLSHRYKARKALEDVSFSVRQGEIFGLLGPNGSGKTTLFRILATSFPPAAGNVKICGFDLMSQFPAIREKIGVAFQSPSLDPKLTVRENLMHQAHLYGLSGRLLKERSQEMSQRLGIADRSGDSVEKLSG
ncbi:MAG TPA: ABC transporter ATP-binding protein, partial [bacterium]|nr:ABC transporter ATP-binding protein [bacterium]